MIVENNTKRTTRPLFLFITADGSHHGLGGRFHPVAERHGDYFKLREPLPFDWFSYLTDQLTQSSSKDSTKPPRGTACPLGKKYPLYQTCPACVPYTSPQRLCRTLCVHQRHLIALTSRQNGLNIRTLTIEMHQQHRLRQAPHAPLRPRARYVPAPRYRWRPRPAPSHLPRP